MARAEAQTGNQNAAKEKTVYPQIEGTLKRTIQYQKSPTATAKAAMLEVSRAASHGLIHRLPLLNLGNKKAPLRGLDVTIMSSDLLGSVDMNYA